MIKGIGKVLYESLIELKSCDEFFFCVAFLTMGGYQQLCKIIVK